jgi:DNA repair exonuclease SbcCD ATPase subunit
MMLHSFYVKLLVSQQAQMSQDMQQLDKMRVNQHKCPVCSYGVKKNSVNARKALQEHIRRAAVVDPLHGIWKDAHYSQHFCWGGCVKPSVPVASDIINAIKRVYGEDWGRKCEQAFNVDNMEQ